MEIDDITVGLLQEDEGAERHESRLRFGSGEIVEIEPPGSGWYTIEPTPELVDLVERFVHRMILRREGIAGKDAVLPGAFAAEAKTIALRYAREICAHINADEEFVELADGYSNTLKVEVKERS